MKFFKLDTGGRSGTRTVTKSRKKEIPLLNEPAGKSASGTKTPEKYESFSDLVDEGEFDEF